MITPLHIDLKKAIREEVMFRFEKFRQGALVNRSVPAIVLYERDLEDFIDRVWVRLNEKANELTNEAK